MIRNIAYIIYKFLIFFDCILYKITKKNFRYYLYNFLRDSSYTSIKIEEKNVKFFVPSYITRERVRKIFTKEPDTISWINNFEKFNIKESSIMWDIGANIGLFSIYASTKHKNLKVFSFEPSTSNLVILSRNISINNLEEKIIINQIALTDKENKYLKLKETTFLEGGALNTFGEEYDYKGENFNAKNSYRLYGTSIDYLIENNILEIPDFIKVDVDGIEHLILNGAKKLLKEQKIKSIQIEINEDFKEQNNLCLQKLSESGFILKSKNLLSSGRNLSPRFSKVFNCVFERK